MTDLTIDHISKSFGATQILRDVSLAVRDGEFLSIELVKLALAMVSMLVLSLTGYGWATFKTLHEGLSTTDVIGWAVPDKATDLLLVGLDSRTDAHDNPLAPDVLARLRTGDNEGELTDTMILVRIPNDGQHAVAVSLPRDLYVELPDGYGKHKLNSAFARARNATALDKDDPTVLYNLGLAEWFAGERRTARACSVA